jgi:hypothetical protein
MTSFYDDACADEHAEIIAKLKTTKKALQNAAKAITELQKSNDDIENISNDTYSVLVALLWKLRENYDIEAMAQDALAD